MNANPNMAILFPVTVWNSLSTISFANLLRWKSFIAITWRKEAEERGREISAVKLKMSCVSKLNYQQEPDNFLYQFYCSLKLSHQSFFGRCASNTTLSLKKSIPTLKIIISHLIIIIYVPDASSRRPEGGSEPHRDRPDSARLSGNSCHQIQH